MLAFSFFSVCLLWDCCWGEESEKLESRLALPNEFPWVVSVQDESMTHLGGGSVITQYFVLTACSPIYKRTKVLVMAGSTKLKQEDNEPWTGQTKNSSEVFIHDGCKESHTGGIRAKYYGWESNCALIKLTEPFTFDNSVGPIAFPNSVLIWDATQADNTARMLDKKCFTVGWGFFGTKFKTTFITNYDLYVVNTKVIEDKTCRGTLCQFFTKDRHCEPTHFATAERKEFGALEPFNLEFYGITGDVGAAFVCEGLFHGITAWRPSKIIYMPWKPKTLFFADESVPTMYLSIESIWEWIGGHVPDLPSPTTLGTTILPDSTTISPEPSRAITLVVHPFIQLTMFVSFLYWR